jgi:hypothetical protein
MGIGRRKFQHIAAQAEADVNLIIEVNRPGRFRRNPIPLKTRLGINETLRRFRNVQFLQNRHEIAEIPIVLPIRNLGRQAIV